jgi:tripartite-type tricarboxylate transporter receptor subunit TctC
MVRFTRRHALGVVGAGVFAPQILRAQSGLTTGTITIVAPFPAGGSSDAKARIVATGIANLLGRSVIVENQAGGGGRVAARTVKSAPPDGSKILLANTSVMVLTPMLPDAGYDSLADFVPVAGGSEFAAGLATGPMTGAKNLAELAAWLKANPTKANFGIPAAGSLPHLTGIAFGKSIGVELTAVPYRGGAPMAQDLLAGQLAVGIAAAADFAGLHQAGQLRLVGVTGTRRAPGLADVQTFSEAGHKGMEANAWNAFFVPTGTPAAIITELNRAINTVLERAEVKEQLEKIALVSAPSAPEAPTAWIKRDQATFRPLLIAAGLVK